MKNILLFLTMVLIAGFGNTAQPLRKPFAQIRVDGRPYKSGDILTLKPGQKLLIEVEMEGGRRDFCKFPDIYADITGTADILSRGEKGIAYELNGEKAEWMLTGEQTHFDTGELLQVTTLDNPLNARVSISNKKFSQAYLKVTAKTQWQFTRNGQTQKEQNVAEQTIYFKVAGESDVWFSTPNVQASGISNDLIRDKLKDVQAANDSIETNFYRLNFVAVQQSIKNLQIAVNTLKSTIDEVTAANPSYKARVIFLGLPSDHLLSDIGNFPAVHNSWVAQEALVNDQKMQIGKLPSEATTAGKDKLVSLIAIYADWQNKLPVNTFNLIARYMPDMNVEAIRLPEAVYAVSKEKMVSAYPQMVSELNAFLDQRLAQVPGEILKIGVAQSKLQAVRLFDGMLRSYFSSISWGEWKETRSIQQATSALDPEFVAGSPQ